MFGKSAPQRDDSAAPMDQTPPAATFDRNSRTPAVAIRETAEAILIEADLPGAKPDQLQLSVKNGVLTLYAPVAVSAREGFKALHREYDDLDFRRAFTLPDNVDGEGISASAKYGVVTITLPKVKAAQPRRIAVAVG